MVRWLVFLALACAAACSATPVVPVSEFAGASLPSLGESGGEVGQFQTDDGIAIRYAKFEATGTPIGTAVLITGRTQFIEVYLEQIGQLRSRGWQVWAMDWRGQGLSGGHLPDDPHKGHSLTFDRYLRDLQQFRQTVVQPVGARTLLVGQSMGGGLAVRYVIEHPGDFQAVVAGAPLLGLAVPDAVAAIVAWQGKSSPTEYVSGQGGYDGDTRKFDGNSYTRDRTRFLRQHAYIDREPKLALGGPTKGWIRAAKIHGEMFEDPLYVQRLRTPVLILAAEDESLVSNDAQEDLAAQNRLVERVVLPDALHEVWLGDDATQKRLWLAVDGFLAKHAPASPVAKPQ